MTPMPDEDVDALDDNVATVLQQADCDTCSQILLPKQLHLDDGAEDLLLWFRDTVKQAGVGAVPASDAKAHMVLPPGLFAEERKEWHFMCSVQQLRSFSRGLGPQRRLFIGAAPLGDAAGKWERPDVGVAEKARELHTMLVEEQGGHCQYSLGELREMVASGAPLPAELIAFRAIRDESERLWKAVDGAREAETVQLLRDAQYAKEVVFKKHPTSGAFLVHAAVDRNMQQVARELANPERYPGVLQQVDGQGRTALSIACNMRNVDLVVAFMAAGARDTRNDVDALHQTLIRTGDSARRAVLNKCALTTSFRRQHLSPAHAATSAPGRAAAAEDRARREREEGPGAAPARRRTDLPAQIEAAAEPDPIAEAAPAQPRGRRQVTAGGMNMLGALLRQPRTAAAAAGPRTIAAGTAPDNAPAATAPLEDVTNEQSVPPGFAESRLSQPRLSGTSGGAASGWLATDEYSSNGEDASFPDLGSKQLLKHGRHLQLASGSAAPPHSPAASLDRLPPGFGPNSASSAAGSGGGRGRERQAGGLRESVSAAHEASTKQPRRPGSAGKPTRGARERIRILLAEQRERGVDL